jgi:2-polyprenyl-3-methyl-5-hydroxy-6-metoxy-1,4-benzoquinol methylase
MDEKPRTYYSPLRSDIADLLPSQVSRSLEVGCGTGSTSGWIKQKYGAYVAGVELCEDAAHEAERSMDLVLIGDVEKMPLPFSPESFDLILCLDVLEHLADPWSSVTRLVSFMKPGASFITSLPNIQHYSTFFNLLRGRWNYTVQGFMDKTHLRFFVRSTAIAMFEDAGLKVDAVKAEMSGIKIIDRCTFGMFQDFCAGHYLIRACLENPTSADLDERRLTGSK